MKTVIIDDNLPSIDVLAEKLKRFDDINLVGTATNGDIGLRLVREIVPELVFLDIELPDMTGVEFLEQINELLIKRLII